MMTARHQHDHQHNHLQGREAGDVELADRPFQASVQPGVPQGVGEAVFQGAQRDVGEAA